MFHFAETICHTKVSHWERNVIGRLKIICRLLIHWNPKKKGIVLLIIVLQGSTFTPLHFPSHLHITCTFVHTDDSCARQREWFEEALRKLMLVLWANLSSLRGHRPFPKMKSSWTITAMQLCSYWCLCLWKRMIGRSFTEVAAGPVSQPFFYE